MMRWVTLAILFIGTYVQSQSTDPFERGPYETTYIDIDTSAETEIDHNIAIFSPNATGNFPVIYLAMGVFGLISPRAYDAVMDRVASHGFTVITPHHLDTTFIEDVHGEWLLKVDVWCRENLLDTLIDEGIDEGLTLDFESQFVVGHSGGGHVICEYLKRGGCDAAKGYVMLSPVDGMDPFAIIQEFCIAEGEILNYDIPSLIIANGLDSVPGQNTIHLPPSCSPERQGNIRFYNAMPGTVWLVNATNFGHADMFSGLYWATWGSVCYSEGNVLELIKYRNFIAGEIVAFINALNNGDCDMFKYFEDPSTVPIDVTVMKKEVLSNDELCGSKGYCRWTAEGGSSPPPAEGTTSSNAQASLKVSTVLLVGIFGYQLF